MIEALDRLPQELQEAAKPFDPIARYYPAMDSLLYLKEDRSYRADRVDRFLTLLWHPHEERLIGIKIKGFRRLCRESKTLSDVAKDDTLFLSLAALVASVYLLQEAETIMARMEPPRREQLTQKYGMV